MTKLIVQFILSVILSFSVGAAMGFNPKVRTNIYDTVLLTNTSIQDNVTATVKNINKQLSQNLLRAANRDPLISLKSNVTAPTKSNAKADLHLKNELKTTINTKDVSTVNKLPEPPANNSVANGTQTNQGLDISELDRQIEDTINSTLNLNLIGPGK